MSDISKTADKPVFRPYQPRAAVARHVVAAEQLAGPRASSANDAAVANEPAANSAQEDARDERARAA